jgi:gluconokinase
MTSEGAGHPLPAACAVVVMGVAGSGKSTLAAALAVARGWRLLEGDAFHSPGSIAKMRSGIALDDGDRLPWLDALAAAIEHEVAAGRSVVATCSALRVAYRDRLRRCCRGPLHFVWLRMDAHTAAARLRLRAGHFFNPDLLPSQFDALEAPSPAEALALDATLPVPALLSQIDEAVL